jgi:uncharacterized protein (TIGR00369 family)
MTFDQHIGMSRGDSDSEAKIETQDHHLNPTGNINGGVLISLADNLATGVANRHWREKTGDQAFLVGVDLHAVMLTNQQGGTIIARSKPVRIGRRIVVIRTQVSGEDNKLLAEITSTHIPVTN